MNYSSRRATYLMNRYVPTEGIVVVIGTGGEEWLGSSNRKVWVLPRDAQCRADAGQPACDIAAIAQLETLRARGATHLLLPEASYGWLTTYPAFLQHLERHATLIQQGSAAFRLYDLSRKPAAAAANHSPSARFERLAKALGRPPQMLDLTGSPETRRRFPDVVLFAPPKTGSDAPLPYIDSSVDLVAVASATPSLLDEARRVAGLAVVDCTTEVRVDWLREPPALRLPSVSIIVPVFNQWPITKGCLEAIYATLPLECSIEVIVNDDASTDETATALESLSRAEPRLKVLRNPENCGFVESCNRAAATATGDVLVFLNNDTVPLPGWLEPLLGTLTRFPRVGAVGGKLLFPDGRLQEAGGIVFSDASACHFGRDETDCRGPLFDYVRQVDYISGALLATPRELFASMGGFDTDFAPGYYEDTDYCFRLRERGYAVYYQPETVVVHLEGGTAGTDHAVGMKRHQEINRERFRMRHATALRQQRPRPNQIDTSSWLDLAHRGPGRGAP